MPELPEVETIARDLNAQVRHRTITGIEKLDWARMVETPDLPQFRATLPGSQIQQAGRRAKWLLLTLDRGHGSGWTLALHLRMSGRLWVADPADLPDQHTHLVLALDDQRRMFFRDPRKFGRVRLLDPAGLNALDAALGPEPLSDTFTAEQFHTMLGQHRTPLKPLLLNQAFLAGLGNIYVDETLWLARLHPLRPANTLEADDTAHLHTALRTVLERAIAAGGSTLRDYRNGYGNIGQNQAFFAVYGCQGKPCPHCATPIVRCVVAQRGTHLCPFCQKLPDQ